MCGPESTFLVPPAIQELSKASVDNELLLTESAEFITSNPNCPVDSFTIDTDIFELTTDLPTFSVKLDESKLSLEAIYPYMITATAEGGATASLSDNMEVFNACRNTLISSF